MMFRKKIKVVFVGCCFFGIGLWKIGPVGLPMSKMANTKFYCLFFPSGACELGPMKSCFPHVAHLSQCQFGPPNPVHLKHFQNISQNISQTKKLKNLIFLNLNFYIKKKIKSCFCRFLFFWNRTLEDRAGGTPHV